MKRIPALLLLLTVILASCGSSKTYFTSSIRTRVEGSQVSLKKIQYYADRDIVLKREMETGVTKVSSGKLKLENGHYVNIITLKKNTPGVCTYVSATAIGIAFETGDSKFLTFGKTKQSTPDDPYRILANSWEGEFGLVMYEGKQYYIQPEEHLGSFQHH